MAFSASPVGDGEKIKEQWGKRQREREVIKSDRRDRERDYSG